MGTFSVTINGAQQNYVSTALVSDVTYENFPTFGLFSEYLTLDLFEQPIGIGGGADAALSYLAVGSFSGVELIGFTPTPVPEPSTLLSLASMLLGFGFGTQWPHRLG